VVQGHRLATIANDGAAECDVHNAAFYELGLRWHWDSDVYRGLQSVPPGRRRIAHYLQQHQAHLLKAYDLEFLVDAIEARVQTRRDILARTRPPSNFNWAATSVGELGA
jgi:hypothetical protein